ncbi:MAG TPA: monovalent cation/H(+) antiporter subunit G [Thermohalobaculum sp.]|nr:monovalent cation/H(+) antiporter subunit G [Thermohalobaculum sp.]
MDQVIDILSWAALVGGGFFYVVGAIGLNRMPDIFTRMHAVSVSETLGVGLMVLGMALQAGLSLVTVKLVIIMVVMMWTGSVATHALARAALHDGEKPLLADAEGQLVETDPVSLFPELGARLIAPLTSETIEEAPAEVPMGPDGPLDEDEANRDARAPGSGGGV